MLMRQRNSGKAQSERMSDVWQKLYASASIWAMYGLGGRRVRYLVSLDIDSRIRKQRYMRSL